MVVCKWQDSMDLYKFEIGDIYWKKATLNIMTVSPPTLNPMYLKLQLTMTERESLTKRQLRNRKSCQDAVTCQIPNFCLDCPRVRYSIQRDTNSLFFMSLIFAWIALSGFPPRRSFLPKPPFRVFNLASYYVFILGEVFLDCI